MRGLQVPAAQVRERVHLRALLRLGAGRGALRVGAQGVRRQQRVQAAAPDPAPQAPGRRRHRLLRDPGAPPRPHLRLRLPHLRPPATGMHDGARGVVVLVQKDMSTIVFIMVFVFRTIQADAWADEIS